MAEKMTVDLDSDVQVDYGEHERTYRTFIAGSKWSIVGIIVVLIVIALLVY